MKINTVLFDIGGVLTPDPFETIILHDKKGIGRSLGIGTDELVKRLQHIWDKFAILPSADEQDFWQDISDALQIHINMKDIEEIKHDVIVVNPEATKIFKVLKSHGYKIGIVSSNTAFFYPFQARKLSLTYYVDPSLVFLSNDMRKTKADGMFKLVARRVPPKTTLVIDDSPDNVEKAKQEGFNTIQYSMEESLLGVVTKLLNVPNT